MIFFSGVRTLCDFYSCTSLLTPVISRQADVYKVNKALFTFNSAPRAGWTRPMTIYNIYKAMRIFVKPLFWNLYCSPQVVLFVFVIGAFPFVSESPQQAAETVSSYSHTRHACACRVHTHADQWVSRTLNQISMTKYCEILKNWENVIFKLTMKIPKHTVFTVWMNIWI